MVMLLENIEQLSRFTPSEVEDRSKRKTPGNKLDFLRAASGLMSAAEGARLRKVIEESCERIDE